MKQVLFVDHVSRILGGAEINLIELLEALPNPKNQRFACACPASSRLAQAIGRLKIPVLDYGLDDSLNQMRLVGRRFSLFESLRGLAALRRAGRRLEEIIAEVQPDRVISCTNKDHFAASSACRQQRLPSVWWVNDIVSADFFPWAARFAFKRQALKAATRVAVVSEFAREALLRLGLPGNQVAMIHNGIPLKRYQRTARGHLRGPLGLAKDEPLVGIVGRFTPWKGQEVFLELARSWVRRHAAGHFVLIGHAFNEDQAFEAGLRRFVADENLGARVHFAPFQDPIAAALSDLDVLVHASTRPEPFGRVIIEAMAIGVPVIAARAGAVPEIVSDGVDGLLAEPGNVEDYAAKLERLLGSTELSNALSRAGQQTVRQHFSLERVVRQWEDLLAATPRVV